MDKLENKIITEERFMRAALKQAKKAFEKGEVPVGAVIVKDGKIIARGRNTKESTKNALAHAEINCILKAQKKLNDWRLNECEMYVTMEPCPMCAGAILNSRLKKLYYSTPDYKAGCVDTLYSLLSDRRFLWQTETKGGILQNECLLLLQNFFKQVRKKK